MLKGWVAFSENMDRGERSVCVCFYCLNLYKKKTLKQEEPNAESRAIAGLDFT